MFELVKLTENDYYIESPTKIGVIKISQNEVILIDTGIDKSVGKRILSILNDNNLKLVAIFNTHSHADHIGGNNYLQNNTNCKIFASSKEYPSIVMPSYEPILLYGGFPINELKNHFFLAKTSNVRIINDEVINMYNIKMIELPGHTIGMVGFITKDNTFFLADAISNPQTLDKHKVWYTYNIENAFMSIETIKKISVDRYLPSHGEVVNSINDLSNLNIDYMNIIIDNLLNMLNKKMIFDDIMEMIFRNLDIEMNIKQYYLIGSTIKSYLSYLRNKKLIDIIIDDNKLYWSKT